MNVQVTAKEITINPNFVSKNDTKFSSNNLCNLAGNSCTEFETDPNKLGGLVPDIAVQIQNGPKLKDHFSFDPFKVISEIWTVKSR